MFIRLIFKITLCLIGLASESFGQSLSIETLTSYPLPAALTSASQGAKIALAINEQGKRNVYVGEGPSFTLRKLTAYTMDNGDEISGITLTSDGKRVVYVKGGDHGAFDESEPRNPASMPIEPKVQIWSIPFSGGKTVCLGDGDYPVISPDGKQVAFERQGQIWTVPTDGSQAAKRLFFAKGRNGSPQWSPDGKMLAFVSNRGDHALIGLYRNLETPIQWLAPDFAKDSSPRWSPDGKSIVFVRTAASGGAPDSLTVQHPNPWSIWKVSIADGQSNCLWSSPKTLEGSIPITHGGFNLHWAAQNRIVFLSYQDGWPHLYSIPDTGGDAVLLTPGNFMVEYVQLSHDGHWLLFSANTGPDPDDMDRRHIFRVPVDQATMESLTSGAGIEAYPVLTGDGKQVAFIHSSISRPPMPAIMPFTPDGKIQLLGKDLLPPTLAEAQLVTPKRVEWKAPDGEMVYGQLFEPANQTEKHPAVVFVHGGPSRQMLMGWHYSDYYANTYALNQYLVSRGFTVLAVNYRLGIGYGYHFQRPKSAGRFGAAEYQDVKAAGEWLAKQSLVDPKRIGIYGGSYGGYLTALALGKDSGLFAAGVDIHGVHNYIERIATNMPEPAPDIDRAVRLAKASSPVSYVDTWSSPTLFIHGDDDGNVDFHQSVDLIGRLKQKQAPIETLMVPDETHHWLRYHNQVMVDKATAEFLERKLTALKNQ